MLNWYLFPLTFVLASCSLEGRAENNALVRAGAIAPPPVEQVGSDATMKLALNSQVAPTTRAVPNVEQQQPGKVLQTSDLGPATMCEGAVTHNERVLIPPVAKPPFMKYYKDPAFGSKVIRITNTALDEVLKPSYSTMQAWNADESLLMLYRGGNDGGYHLLVDGHTYKPFRKLDIIPSDLEEIYWSHSDPDALYYVSGYATDLGLFKKYSVSRGKATVVKDFSKFCGARGMPTGGGDVHMQSMDDDLWGFRCQLGDGTYKALSYRISTDEVFSMKIGEGTPWEEWTAPTAAPSGDRFWYQGKAISPDLKTIEKTMDLYKAGEHSNVGLTYDGQDALFQTAFDPSPDGCEGDIRQGVGHLVEHNLQTGSCRPMINENRGYPYTTSSTHVSARAYLRPGWIAMSSIGRADDFRYFTNKRKAPALLSEIYLADTHPDKMQTCRLAHHRSFGKDAQNGSYSSYFGEPHATISPSGTRILFGSDWYDSGSVDSYVIELPGYVKPK